jgi:hypothetical protein
MPIPRLFRGGSDEERIVARLNGLAAIAPRMVGTPSFGVYFPPAHDLGVPAINSHKPAFSGHISTMGAAAIV